MDIKTLILIGGGLLIIAVVLHGFWITWRSKRGGLRMAIEPGVGTTASQAYDDSLSELPGGGWRLVKGEPILIDAVGNGPAVSDVEANAMHEELLGSAPTEQRTPDRPVRGPKPRPTASETLRTNGQGFDSVGVAKHAGGYAQGARGQRSTRASREADGGESTLRDRVESVMIAPDAKPVVKRAPARTADAETAASVEAGDANGQRDEAELRESVVTIYVIGRNGETFTGRQILDVMKRNGLNYGEMNIYHRSSRINTPGQSAVFSVANAEPPGTFDVSEPKLDSTRSRGVVLFVRLDEQANPVAAFEDMRRVAANIKASLGGEMRDENRSIITNQTLDHYKTMVAEYARRRTPPRRA